MKKRIDVLLVEQGFFESREKAKRSIMAGLVFVDNQKCDKAGTEVKTDAKIEVKGNPIPYVSRGGLKLEKAMKNFDITLQDKVCMDIGASTGGFTDCMLQNGARKVFSIDVGYGQLAWKLRQDDRVVCMERTNIRYVTIEDTKEFAENWLIIYNTARENKKSFLNCKLFFNSDIVVLTTVNDEKNVKEWLSRFGDVYIKDVKYRLLDFDGDYEYDTEYDIIDN